MRPNSKNPGALAGATGAETKVHFHADYEKFSAAGVAAQARRRSLVEALHRLGPRALFEFLLEFGHNCHTTDFPLTETLTAKLEEYARLTPEMLAFSGGDRWSTLPLTAIDGGLA